MMKAVAKAVEPADREARFDHIRPLYLEALTLVERLHRLERFWTDQILYRL